MRPSQYNYIKRALCRTMYNRKARKKRIKLQKKRVHKQKRHNTYIHLLKRHKTFKKFDYKNIFLFLGIVLFGSLTLFQVILWFIELQNIREQIGLLKGMIILIAELIIFGGLTYLCYYGYKRNHTNGKDSPLSSEANILNYSLGTYSLADGSIQDNSNNPLKTNFDMSVSRKGSVKNKWINFFLPIPSIILLVLLGICFCFGTVDGNPVRFADWLFMMFIVFGVIIIPFDIIIFFIKKIFFSIENSVQESSNKLIDLQNGSDEKPEPEPEPEPEEIITSKTACSHKNINDIQNQKNDKITNAEINHNKKKTLEESWALERKLRIYNAELREQDEQENYEQYKNLTK